MDLGLSKKKALIAGASRGLGFATALQLVKEDALVILNSRDEQHLIAATQRIEKETGTLPAFVAADVSNAQAATDMVRLAAEKFGGLDILICNAGGPPAGSFEAFDDEAWLKAVDLSFMSNVRMIRAALPYLRRSSAPSVLTITSVSVKQPLPNLILSNSIRAATVGLTKSLALELGQEGIRFNSILPGWTETERVNDLLAFRAKNKGTSPEAERKQIASEIALGRMADPAEFANTAAFLVSPAASYITGVMLTVDGGSYKGTL
jgi:3-oxoacyl-[acyl-carrier protein] reductase